MAISEAIARSVVEAAPPTTGDATATTDGAAAKPTGARTTALLLATLLSLGSVAAWGYTQWWVPREQAQQSAQVSYERCLEEVKVYVGKRNYPDRLAQCTSFATG